MIAKWRAVGFLAIAASACGSRETARRPSDGVAVTNPYVAEALTAEGTAAYFTIANAGAKADTLTGISAPFAERGALHEQVTQGGTVTMRPVGSVAVPAGGEVVFAPGGRHAMLTGLRRLPVVGDQVTLTLTFRHAGRVMVDAPVVAYADLEERAAARP